jgi:DNA-binding transcriptional MerR regulator
LTLEPGFKSTTRVDSSLTIGNIADRAGVATSAVRYYERRGLLRADHRESGQRRYGEPGLRRLVFIGMLQDAGLSLDDIAGGLDADDVEEWKQIARARLDALDLEIERLRRSRELLAGALLCRYDHPLDECRVMGREIDARLAATAPDD